MSFDMGFINIDNCWKQPGFVIICGLNVHMLE